MALRLEGSRIIEQKRHGDKALSSFAKVLGRTLAGTDPRSLNVRVTREGQWFVLRGRVASQRLRTRLFDAVPRRDGAKWVVDGIEVGPISGESI